MSLSTVKVQVALMDQKFIHSLTILLCKIVIKEKKKKVYGSSQIVHISMNSFTDSILNNQHFKLLTSSNPCLHFLEE